MANITGTNADNTLNGTNSADTITGLNGSDTITARGGNDRVVAGPATQVNSPLILNWAAAGADESSIAGGFTQNTGGVNVTVSYTDTGGGTGFTVESTDTQYRATGETFATRSAASLAGTGAGPTSTVGVSFAGVAGAGFQNEVTNVSFRINDIDAGGWQDIVTINAYDAAGNLVPVTITPAGNDTVSGNTITAGPTNDTTSSANGSALITIAGPIARFEIVYANGGTTGQVLNITNIHFDAQPIDNDTVFGGNGNDTIDGGFGDDVLNGEAGADSILGGLGDDTVDGGPEADVIDGGDGNDSLLGGAGNDTLSGGSGSDQLFGEAGSDRFTGLTAGDVVTGGEDAGNADTDVLDLFGSGWTKANTNILFSDPSHENGTVQFLDANGNVTGTLAFANIETIVPCFTPGTLIDTDRGPVAVEALSPGDRVLTLDHGYQTLRWMGCRVLAPEDLSRAPELRPVLIGRGALGRGLPERDLRVSPQHRVLLQGAQAELVAGETEVLAPAMHLLGLPGVAQDAAATGVRYIHLLFDRHEIVRSDGLWTESFQPGGAVISGMEANQRAELLALFPGLSTAHDARYPSARSTVKRHEARLILAS